ncbi:MAG: UTP--glucose-1-phosphate uridylyltransferase [Holosporales bacterium]
MSQEIKKAVFPVAGLGTRFLPATKASPKEMLPIVDKPLIQYAVEEAYEAGIRQMIFITGRNKRAIEDHFDVAFELEAELCNKAKKELMDLVESTRPKDMECVFVRQSNALGLGHAVLCAKNIVNNEPFAVLLADDLMISEKSVLKQMVDVFESTNSSVIAIEKINPKDTDKYGIINGTKIDDKIIEISSIVEKPKPDVAPSTLAVAGRYILMPSIFNSIDQSNMGVGKEIQLTDGISNLLVFEKVYGLVFDGNRYDCGSKLGFLKATVDVARSHKEIGDDFRKWLGEV